MDKVGHLKSSVRSPALARLQLTSSKLANLLLLQDCREYMVSQSWLITSCTLLFQYASDGLTNKITFKLEPGFL